MPLTRKLKSLFPFLILFALLAILWRELFFAKPNELPSALIGEPIPVFQLATLFPAQKMFTQKDLLGHVTLLNVWATWCYACTLEQPMLLKIKNDYHVKIYSFDYKDDADAARKWLQKNGNPFFLIGMDKHGDAAIDFGVYGTPETFVISSQGKIVYRHIGVLDQKTWDEVIYPLMQKYGVNNAS